MTEPLLHLCSDIQWRSAQELGFVGADSLETEHYLHLSTRQQVQLPANRLYAGRTDLVLLCIDPARLSSEIRWEPGVSEDPESMHFPHLYGPLPTSAVTAVLDYQPDAGGTFRPPHDVPDIGDPQAFDP